MVENFTLENQETILRNTQETAEDIDQEFEKSIKSEMQNLLIEPRQTVIDAILNYSKQFSK